MKDEPALLAGLRAGERSAFAALIDAHQRAVRAFLGRVCIDKNDVDDIAQETFIAAWAQAWRFRGGSSLRTWLCAIAWRKARDAERASRRRLSRDGAHAEIAALEKPGEVCSEDKLAVREALAELPLEQRAAVALCLGGEFSNAEAAEILRMPLGTVKSHVARGRARLLRALGEET